MTLLFKVEDVFDISGRGCVMAPEIPFSSLDISIRVRDRIQLRTPEGDVLNTYIASIELVKPSDGSACRAAIVLPRELLKKDVPIGTEVYWVGQ